MANSKQVDSSSQVPPAGKISRAEAVRKNGFSDVLGVRGRPRKWYAPDEKPHQTREELAQDLQCSVSTVRDSFRAVAVAKGLAAPTPRQQSMREQRDYWRDAYWRCELEKESIETRLAELEKQINGQYMPIYGGRGERRIKGHKMSIYRGAA